MIELKTCSKCNEPKETRDFYLNKGKLRSECKKCSLKKIKEYQSKQPPRKVKIVDKDARNAYAREYRKKHPEKFKKYREDFLARNPGYFDAYYVKNKAKD